MREWFINTALYDVFWSDGGPPFGSSDVNNFLRRWGVEWRPSSPRYPQGKSVAESAVKWAKSLLRKCWRGRGQLLRTNKEWIKGILQWKNTPHKSTDLSPAIMLYGHSVQDAIIPCSLSRSWHDEKLRVDREAVKRKEKLEKYYNRGTRNLEQLNVNDPVCIQNNSTRRLDRYGRVMESHHQSRRYLIKLESGLMIRRNRIHLRKRYFHPKNNTNSTEPSNYFNDDDVKNNELNDNSDDKVGNNFNRAVTKTESSCNEPRRSDREHRRPRRFDDYVME